MSNYRIIGIDLAKHVFQVCALNQAGKIVFNKQLTRSKLAGFIQELPKTQIAVEACGSANYWGRRFEAMGHTVRLVPAQHVKPFVRGNKNDRNDAQAICEAALRPGMHFVPLKSVDHQDVQMIHRIRQRKVQTSTALANQLRAYLRENGIIVAVQIHHLLKAIPGILEDADNSLTEFARQSIRGLYADLQHTRAGIADLNQQLQRWISQDEDCQRLLELPGYGPIIVSALVSAIGNGYQFTNGRQLSAWVGLTPRHVSSGGKTVLLGTTKRGNAYLRTLLVHGARTVVTWSKHKDDRLSLWIKALVARRGKQKAMVALANKMARVAWVILNKKEHYRADYTATKKAVANAKKVKKAKAA